MDGPDNSEITVTTELVPGDKIGEVKPAIIGRLHRKYLFAFVRILKFIFVFSTLKFKFIIF